MSTTCVISDFDFDLPASQIAQEARPRGASRLLVVDRAAGRWHEAAFADLPRLLTPGDLLVVNDTRVFPARLIGRRDPSGGAVECFLLERVNDHRWQALVHPGQKLKPGAKFVFKDAARAPGVALHGTILERRFFGRRLVAFDVKERVDLDDAIDAIGHVPLPPHASIAKTHVEDRERYQTIFARERGSVAAPTAGLHFDAALLAASRLRGDRACDPITLHVGYGTFQPVRVDRVEDHRVDAEALHISASVADDLSRGPRSRRRPDRRGGHDDDASARKRGGRADGASSRGRRDRRSCFIHPGRTFRAVDALVTNFHLPRSSLLMLVAAFAGRDLTLAAYRAAVENGFTSTVTAMRC